jgi:hypothetical protein
VTENPFPDAIDRVPLQVADYDTGQTLMFPAEDRAPAATDLGLQLLASDESGQEIRVIFGGYA